MFENYYQTELSYLRDMGRAFAAKHPALAGMLSERGTDPDVERLLEGFAFVAARLRQRIDDAAPELVESLTELLIPHALRPTPAMSVVEVRPASRTLRGQVRVERGTRMLSTSVRGTRCTFTTAQPLDVLPLKLVSLRLDDASASKPELTLRFEAEPGTEPAVFQSKGLRFHLHGELATTTQLYLWLSRHLSSVSVRSGSGVTTQRVELGPRALRMVGFDADDALLPWPQFSAHSTRLLLEYFTLPSKFLFFDITQLERAAHIARPSFEVVLGFHKPPALTTRLPEDVLRMHCVPVVNLFEAGAEPIRAELDERPTLVRAAGVDPSHMEVFSVQSVVGLARASGRRTYAPFHSFKQALARSGGVGYYKLTRQPSPVDDGMHTFLTVQRAAEALLERDAETLSIELLCTNRSLPEDLQIGDIASPTSDLPSGLSFSNISRVSPPLRAPLGADLLWHFLSHVACSRRSLADADVLKALLMLYGVSGRGEDAESRVKRAKIEAIRSVRAETITRVVGGVATRGSLYRIELDQNGFASDGDAYLFGAVLHQLLAIDAQLNSFADLRVTMVPSASEWRYDAVINTQSYSKLGSRAEEPRGSTNLRSRAEEPRASTKTESR